MRYAGTLICVSDLVRSREFYEVLLGQTVQFDFGVNIGYASGLALHDRTHFRGLIEGREIHPGGHDGELFFEHDDLAGFARELERRGVELVQSLREQPWRQLTVRFYDPDRHVVEVGEAMDATIRRLHAAGMNPAAIREATGMPDAAVRAALEATHG